MKVILNDAIKKKLIISIENLRKINLFIEIYLFINIQQYLIKISKKMKLNLNFVNKVPKIAKDNEIILLTQKIIKGMIKRKSGRILFITSIIGHSGNPGQSNYSASKAGLTAFSKSLAAEVASRGITSNCIAPGFIKTPMTQKLTEDQQNQILKNMKRGLNSSGIKKKIDFLRKANKEISIRTSRDNIL